MADDEFPREGELESRQGKLYPVGRALRRTFDAENHDSLGTDLTGLMLELARIEPEAPPLPGRGTMPLAPGPSIAAAAEPAPVAPPPAPATAPAMVAQPSGWRAAMARLLR